MTIRESRTMRSRVLSVLAAIIVLSVATAACGGSGGSGSASPPQTIDITMRDINFVPDQVTVPAGKTVRFVFHNQGNMPHDAFIGDDQAQMAHEQDMRSSMADMHHDGGNTITVEPAMTGMLTRTLHAGDRLLIGCHQPGHYAAGMKLTVTVS
jgi:uncharacterized cupredoxin-like copper-binding protein